MLTVGVALFATFPGFLANFLANAFLSTIADPAPEAPDGSPPEALQVGLRLQAEQRPPKRCAPDSPKSKSGSSPISGVRQENPARLRS